MEQLSSCDGIVMGLLIRTSLFYHTILFMSRVLKPFYNTAVSLFYSLIKIATFFISVSLSLYIEVLFYRPTNELEVNYIAFHLSFFSSGAKQGSKNGYCFSNVCFILKIFLLLDVKFVLTRF